MSDEYRRTWDRVFSRSKEYEEYDLDLLCQMYVRNAKLHFSDCPQLADHEFLQIIEEQGKLPNNCAESFRRSVLSAWATQKRLNREFTWETHIPLRNCFAVLKGLPIRFSNA